MNTAVLNAGPLGAAWLLAPAGRPAPEPVFIRRAVYAALAGSTAVAAVAGARLHPVAPKQGTAAPYLVYQLLSDVTGQNLGGADGTSRARFQVSASSRAQADCETLTGAVRDLFDGFRGALGPVTVTEAWTLDETDLRFPPADGSDRGTFRTTIDVILCYRRPRPANQI